MSKFFPPSGSDLQSSLIQNFCQFTVRCVAISAQAFKCSI